MPRAENPTRLPGYERNGSCVAHWKYGVPVAKTTAGAAPKNDPEAAAGATTGAPLGGSPAICAYSAAGPVTDPVPTLDPAAVPYPASAPANEPGPTLRPNSSA